MTPTLIGWLVLGLPLLLIGLYFMWRRWRTVFWMYFGALVLALGYLTATGALHDVGEPLHAALYGAGDDASPPGETIPETGTAPDAAPATDAIVTDVPTEPYGAEPAPAE